MLYLTSRDLYKLELQISSIILDEIMFQAKKCSKYINYMKEKELSGFTITGTYHLPKDELIHNEITFNCINLALTKSNATKNIQLHLTNKLNIQISKFQKYFWNEDLYNAIASVFTEANIASCIQAIQTLEFSKKMNLFASVIYRIDTQKGNEEMMKCIVKSKIGNRIIGQLLNKNLIVVKEMNIEAFCNHNNIYLIITLILVYLIFKN